jgi:RNA polymerase sigma-70 factor (ECF subfamily)
MLMKALSAMLRSRTRPALEHTRWVGELVRTQRAALVQAAMSEGLLADEALDAIQEGAATLLGRRDWSHLRADPEQAGRLLATLVRNHARNARRRHSRRDVSLEALPVEQEADLTGRDLDGALAEAEAHLALTGCLSTLKQTQRSIVIARFFEGSSGHEVATQLGLTPGNVAVILHRAQTQLRGCLQESRVKFGVTAER